MLPLVHESMWDDNGRAPTRFEDRMDDGARNARLTSAHLVGEN
jgi:hypothetical protein